MRDIGETKSFEYINDGFGSGNNAETRTSIAGRVSEYAKTNPLEFVAETFAVHINGERYDKDVYDLYKFYKGPKLR